jgi:hypothetical protein
MAILNKPQQARVQTIVSIVCFARDNTADVQNGFAIEGWTLFCKIERGLVD